MEIIYSTHIAVGMPGAAAEHIKNVVKAWGEGGVRVHLVYPGQAAKLSYSNVTEYATGSAGNMLQREWQVGSATWRLLRHHRTAYLYHRFAKSSFLPLLWARLLNRLAVVEVNADLHADIRDYGRIKRSVAFLSERLNYRLTQHVVVVSDSIAQAIRSNYGVEEDKISVVANGADVDTFRPLDRQRCCEALNLDPAKRYVAFAGSFQPWQGLETAIDAMAVVAGRRSDCILLLIGDGPMRAELERMRQRLSLHDHVIFCGWQSAEMTAKYLGAADLCLAPYNRLALGESNNDFPPRFKGSPLKIYTYFAAGKAVVATQLRAVGSLVEEAGAGVTVALEDPLALAQAIDELIEADERRLEMGRVARQAAVQSYSWRGVAAKLLDVLKRVGERK